ncbi:sulfatase [Ningiella sp. W23]|uniref:sulfatase n=1 Tax=Ningiella sp. W23 TaxID=3023715 RepID=UPI0037583A8B
MMIYLKLLRLLLTQSKGWTVALILLVCYTLSTGQALASQPRNVVIILADDLGWNDTELLQDNSLIDTPNLKELASQGMIFRNAFSNSPVCSPTRASVLTGQTAARHGSFRPWHHLNEVILTPSVENQTSPDRKSVMPRPANRLDTRFATLSSILKDANYQTAHFGKWHLGKAPFSPLEHGFDVDIPNYHGAGPDGGYLAPWQFARNLQPQQNGEHIDVRLASEAVNWVNQVKNDGAFFLNFWPFSVHTPFDADPLLVNQFRDKTNELHSQRSATYAAMLKHFDDAIGILWQGLKDAGVAENTIIIFSSDNGGNVYDLINEGTNANRATSNFPLRAGKATNFNGGIQVPTAIIWPGLTQPNTLSETPIQSADFFPTLLSGLGIEWPSSHIVDGRDIRPALKGETLQPHPIFIYYPSQPRVPDWMPPSMSVIYENWKLIRSFHYGLTGEESVELDGLIGQHYYHLFDLSNDPSELTNLANIESARLQKLDRLIDDHLLDAKAISPAANSRYREGAFNYGIIGKPQENYRLPQDKVEGLSLVLSVSKQGLTAGETGSVNYQIVQEQVSPLTNNFRFAQFMGPSVEIKDNGEALEFVAPQVTTPQFIGIAFIVENGTQKIEKQAGILLEPVPTAPTLRIQLASAFAAKGAVARFSINAIDNNKDYLDLSVSSEQISTDAIRLSTNLDEVEVSIPSDFSGTSLTLSADLSDGIFSISESITVDVLAQAPDSPSEESGGSDSLFWLLVCAVSVGLRAAFSDRKQSLKLI